MCGLPPSDVAVDAAVMCFVYSCVCAAGGRGLTTGSRCPCVGLHYSAGTAGEASLTIFQGCFIQCSQHNTSIRPSILILEHFPAATTSISEVTDMNLKLSRWQLVYNLTAGVSNIQPVNHIWPTIRVIALHVTIAFSLC